jgi:hypothetical protein
MKTIVLTNPQITLEEAHRLIRENPGCRVVVHLHGAKSAETGKSWCPDCVVAEQPIHDALAALTPEQSNRLILLDVPCERELYRNRAEFKPRKCTTLHSEAVPILIHVASTEEEDAEERLIEKECAVPEKLAKFFTKVLA